MEKFRCRKCKKGIVIFVRHDEKDGTIYKCGNVECEQWYSRIIGQWHFRIYNLERLEKPLEEIAE